MLRLTKVGLGLLALLLVWSTGARAAEPGSEADFDYYVLALSWSPTYCASRRGRDDRMQCRQGRGYDFVVHGLWPQYRSGWPQYCSGPDVEPPEPLVEAMLDIMPSPRLVRHQWEKHGTCSGLSPEAYFALTRALYDGLAIPARYIDPARSIEVSVDQIVADFTASNRKLVADMMSVHCGNRRDRASLAELRICFTRDGSPAPCGGNERRRCRARQLVLPPAR
jgi:ribonuclease T2